MTYEHVALKIENGIARLTIDRPAVMNALNTAAMDELAHATLAAGNDPAVRVLVMTGTGRAFCSGADLSGPVGASKDVLREHANPLIETLYGLRVPVITAVNGAAAGVGCSLALAGDIVIAARSAYFMLAFSRIGLVPDGGATWLIPRLVGRARALRMMLLAERIPAEQAETWGMIHSVVDDDALAATVEDMAARLAEGPPISYALIRRGLRDCLDGTLTEALEIEAVNQGIAGASADFAEGVAAFQQKRKAVFRGK